jgi:hypothetical protein
MRVAGLLYTTGQDRNEDNSIAHLYRGGFNNVGNPMCARGWNRLNGFGYSIWRNTATDDRICKVCLKNAQQRLPPVKSKKRKTKWL